MTAVAWVKPVPFMVTGVSAAPELGEKLANEGVVTVKLDELLPAVLPLEVTVITPVVPPVGTLAVHDVLETQVFVVAVVPLNLTDVKLPELVPK